MDPRDERWEVDQPAYRVTFWTGSSHAEEWEVTGGDVPDVLAWIDEQRRDRGFTLWAAVAQPDGIGLVRLAGVDPTRGALGAARSV